MRRSAVHELPHRRSKWGQCIYRLLFLLMTLRSCPRHRCRRYHVFDVHHPFRLSATARAWEIQLIHCIVSSELQPYRTAELLTAVQGLRIRCGHWPWSRWRTGGAWTMAMVLLYVVVLITFMPWGKNWSLDRHEPPYLWRGSVTCAHRGSACSEKDV